jgi:hypothetical protein
VDISTLDSLAEDLILLSFTDKGKFVAQRLDYGLMASELVRLAARGRIDIEDGCLVVRDQAPVGDAELDAALESLLQRQPGRAVRGRPGWEWRFPPRAEAWVGSPRKGIGSAYLTRLVSAGALRAEPRRLLGTRWVIADPARVADARARLDAIALSKGTVDAAQAALGGLAYWVGAVERRYRGEVNRPARGRMQKIAIGLWLEPLSGGVPDAPASAAPATQEAFRAVVHAATLAVGQVVAAQLAQLAAAGN